MIFKKAPFILICTMLICLNAKGMDFLDEDIINEYCPELNFEDESSFENKFGLGNNELNYDTLPDLQDLQNPLELQYQQNPEELEYLKDTFKDTPFDPLDNLDPLDSLGVYDDQTEYDLDIPYGVNLLENDNFLDDDLYDQMDLADQAIENFENNNPKDFQTDNKLKKPREKRSQCKFKYTGKIYKNNKNPIYFCPFCEYPSSKHGIIRHIKSSNHNCPSYNYSTFDHNAPHTTKNPNGTYTCNLCKETFYSKVEIIKHLLEHHKITKEKLKTNIENIPNIIENNKIKTPKPYKPHKPREKRSQCKFEYTGKAYKKNKNPIYFCPFCEYPSTKNPIIKHIKSSSHNCPSYNYSTFDHNAHHTTKNPNGTYTCNLCKKTSYSKVEIIRHLLEHHKITVKKLKTTIENIPNIIENNKIKTPKPYKLMEKRSQYKFEYTGKVYKNNKTPIYSCPFCDYPSIRSEIIKHIKSSKHNLPNYNYSTFDHNAHHTTKNPNGTYTCNLCKKTFNTKIEIIKHLLEHHKITKEKLKTNIQNIPNIIENNKIKTPKPYTYKPHKPREKRSQCKFEYTGKVYKKNKNPIHFCPFCDFQAIKTNIIKHIKTPKHNLPSYNYSTFDHNASHTTKNANGTYTCNLCKKTFNTKIEIIKHLIEHHKITVKKLKTTIENIPNIIENNKIKTPEPYKPLEKRSQCKFEYTGKVYKNNKTPIYFCPFCEHLGEKSNIIKHIKSFSHNCPSYNYSTFDHNAHHTIKNPNGTYTCNLCKKTFNTKIEIIKHLIEHHKITVKKLKTTIENIPNIIENNKIKTPKPYTYKPRKYNRKKKNILPATLKPLMPIIDINKRKKKQNTIDDQIYSTQLNIPNNVNLFLDLNSPNNDHLNPQRKYNLDYLLNPKNNNPKKSQKDNKLEKLKTNIENIPNIIKNNNIRISTPRKPKKPKNPRINWNNISDKIEKKNGKNHAQCPFCPRTTRVDNLKRHITKEIHNLPNFDFYKFNKNNYHMVKNTNNTFDCKLCNKKNIAQSKILEHLCNSKKENGHQIDRTKIKIQYTLKPIETPKPIKTPKLQRSKINWYNISHEIKRKGVYYHALCPFCPEMMLLSDFENHMPNPHNLPNFDFYNFNKNDYHMVKNTNNTFDCKLCNKKNIAQFKILEHLCNNKKENGHNIDKAKIKIQYQKKILPATFKPIVPVIAINKTNKKRKANEIYSQDGFTQSENPNENRPRKRRRF